MNIGTAKPDARIARARAASPDRLIEPHETYSAARFRDDALALMREITERGRIPLLVGGTMLYFKALRRGPERSAGSRSRDPRSIIDTMAEASGWPALHAELARVDPETAARLEAQRRAAHPARAGGLLHHRQADVGISDKKPKYVYFPYSPIKIALLPSERERAARSASRSASKRCWNWD